MTAMPYTPDLTTKLTEFYNYVWGRDNDFIGYAYMTVKNPEGEFKKFMYEWPRRRDEMVKKTVEWAVLKFEVYYSPVLYHTPRPIKDNVLGTWVLWVDSDGNAPEDWNDDLIPMPDLRIQSSIKGHQHNYWRLDTFLKDVNTIEDLNKRLAKKLDSDMSGWDANQILRPPYTTNQKRDASVTVLYWDSGSRMELA